MAGKKLLALAMIMITRAISYANTVVTRGLGKVAQSVGIED